MITGSHAIISAEDAEPERAFFVDVLQLPTSTHLSGCADTGVRQGGSSSRTPKK
jgi:hypothetical protein